MMDTKREIRILERELKTSNRLGDEARAETEKAKTELSIAQARTNELEITNTQIINVNQQNEYLEKKIDLNAILCKILWCSLFFFI
ncbi:hypothetical protein ACR2XN_28185 [Klebsiella pneumoniae]